MGWNNLWGLWPGSGLTGNTEPYEPPTPESEVIAPADYPRAMEPGFTPLDLAAQIDAFTFGSSLTYFHAVGKCSPLGAVIGRKAEAFANGIVQVMKRDTGTKASDRYVRGRYREWERLLAKPNPIQSRSVFLKQLYAYTSIRGWCYVMPTYPFGFNDRPSQLWILPPWCIDVVGTYNMSLDLLLAGKVPRKVYFTWAGMRKELDESQLILFTDNVLEINPITWLPESRLLSLKMPISNIICGKDAENNLMNKRGGIGFISNDPGKDAIGPMAMTPEEKEMMQREFHASHGLTGNRWLYPITTAAARWNQMAFNVKDLMLQEGHKNNVADICDRFNYPAYLLGITDNGTYANVGEAKKSLYQDAIIPESNTFLEQLNEGLKTPAANIEIEISYDHIEALQVSEFDKANARKTTNQALLIEWESGQITLNEWRTENGLEELTGEQYAMTKPEYDQWLVENGYKPQAPIAPTANTDITQLENENGNPSNKPATAA